MTTELQFFHQFSLLTDEQKAAVLHVIQAFLKSQLEPKKEQQERSSSKKRGAYGSLKGKIFMSPDFDAPLEEMKEYME